MADTDSTPSGGGGNEGTTRYEVDERTLDRTFELFSDRHQRNALEKLRAADDGVASVDDLADHLVAHAPEATDRKRVEVDLHHRILPKFDDTDIVDFDSRTGTVRYHGTEPVEDLLDFVAARTE